MIDSSYARPISSYLPLTFRKFAESQLSSPVVSPKSGASGLDMGLDPTIRSPRRFRIRTISFVSPSPLFSFSFLPLSSPNSRSRSDGPALSTSARFHVPCRPSSRTWFTPQLPLPLTSSASKWHEHSCCRKPVRSGRRAAPSTSRHLQRLSFSTFSGCVSSRLDSSNLIAFCYLREL